MEINNGLESRFDIEAYSMVNTFLKPSNYISKNNHFTSELKVSQVQNMSNIKE